METMDTAPKDGRTILLYCPGDVVEPAWWYDVEPGHEGWYSTESGGVTVEAMFGPPGGWDWPPTGEPRSDDDVALCPRCAAGTTTLEGPLAEGGLQVWRVVHRCGPADSPVCFTTTALSAGEAVLAWNRGEFTIWQ